MLGKIVKIAKRFLKMLFKALFDAGSKMGLANVENSPVLDPRSRVIKPCVVKN